MWFADVDSTTSEEDSTSSDESNISDISNYGNNGDQTETDAEPQSTSD
jgi:hypothetical protein